MEQMSRLAREHINIVLYELKHSYDDFIYPLTKIQWKEHSVRQQGKQLSTDGITIYYEPQYVLKVHKNQLKKEIMHILFHGLLGHFQIKDDYKEKLCRNLIMDVQTDYLMERIMPEYYNCFSSRKRVEQMLSGDISMGQYYRLMQMKACTDLEQLESNNRVDEHHMWDVNVGKEYKKLLVAFWKDVQNVVFGEVLDEESDIALFLESEDEKDCKGEEFTDNKIGADLPEQDNTDGTNTVSRLQVLACMLENKNSKNFGAHSGMERQCYEVGRGGRIDYDELLRELFKISEVSREEPDSIDPMFYHYGMELYEDVPLIEPLEISERPCCLHTIVIAIDVSGSCANSAIMKSFWGETYQCMMQLREHHAEGEVLLLQCDTKIQKEESFLLDSVDEIPEQIEIKGMGGTDFVPVFDRVKELEQTNTVVDVLIYLTDGFGRYPEIKPDYPVYFVLPQQDSYYMDIPDWIDKVYLKM